MDNRPIGVFDSGLGGLTAVKELRRVLPNEDIIFFGDTARIPYGTRSRETIIRYAEQDIRFLLGKDVKFVMAACGTVSSNYPTELAAKLPVPYTGVVSCACRAAARRTRNGKIGVIATNASINSGCYTATLRDIDPALSMIPKACPMFVPLVENGFFGEHNELSERFIAEYLEEVRAAGVDTLILGCTHYPLLAPMIQRYMGEDVTLIDIGKETADCARDALEALGLLADSSRKGSTRFFVSDGAASFAANAATFLGEYAGGPVAQVDLDNPSMRDLKWN